MQYLSLIKKGNRHSLSLRRGKRHKKDEKGTNLQIDGKGMDNLTLEGEALNLDYPMQGPNHSFFMQADNPYYAMQADNSHIHIEGPYRHIPNQA